MGDGAPPDERTACGFVLVRDGEAGVEYLSLVNRKRDEPGLPKGHADPGETELETARRETLEETGLDDLRVVGDFERTLRYEATKRGTTYAKRVVYFLARLRSGEVRLSKEHSAFAWLPLGEMLATMPFDSLRGVVRDAALFLKDPALFALEPATEAEADAYLRSLPEASDVLLAHVRGAARLARRFAEALAEAGAPVHVEAAAVGTLLHDVGRALGDHADHQRAGVKHLRTTPFAAYGFACISHFTKGASSEALWVACGADALVADFRRLVDTSSLTWEERCAALADACMKGDTPSPPQERFDDLRRRYHAHDLIDLQERETESIRRTLESAIGRDPLELVGLAEQP
jgi:bis(5'-nucleosidyl)-tetraphosphatase